jgi:hypothetical protein
MESTALQLNTDPAQWVECPFVFGIPDAKVQSDARRYLNELATATANGTMPKLLKGERSMLCKVFFKAGHQRLSMVECINIEAVYHRYVSI